MDRKDAAMVVHADEGVDAAFRQQQPAKRGAADVCREP
jgi:hypothetical protein